MNSVTSIPAGYVAACKLSDMPQRGKKALYFGETRVLLVACDDHLFAVEDRCPQTGRSIAHGKVWNCAITSPATGARYCLRSGRYLGGGQLSLRSTWLSLFPLLIIDDTIYVYLPD
jgi:nitrite reductase/ring-hydroxylating ferredoxin subunit